MIEDRCPTTMCHTLYLEALSGDWYSALVLSDYLKESPLMPKIGSPYYIVGPLDIVVGIIESMDGAFVVMAPGSITTRDVADETKLIATGKPSGTHYCVHPLGIEIPFLATTRFSRLPRFDKKDWPAEE